MYSSARIDKPAPTFTSAISAARLISGGSASTTHHLQRAKHYLALVESNPTNARIHSDNAIMHLMVVRIRSDRVRSI